MLIILKFSCLWTTEFILLILSLGLLIISIISSLECRSYIFEIYIVVHIIILLSELCLGCWLIKLCEHIKFILYIGCWFSLLMSWLTIRISIKYFSLLLTFSIGLFFCEFSCFDRFWNLQFFKELEKWTIQDCWFISYNHY